jgi:G3E family GTPase
LKAEAGMGDAIPVSVVGGWLGAGKTTLVNHLLRHRGGRRIAVLVNDFGALAIDDALIEAREGPLLRLAGGCVCCSFGSDLLAGLQQLAALTPAPEQVLIECSGVADPRAVARTLGLLRGPVLDAVLVLADAETVRERAADRYVGDLVRRQLAEADLLLLNHTDRVDASTAAGLQTWLATVSAARVICVRHAAIDPALVFGIGPFAAHERAAPLAMRSAAQLFDSLAIEFTHAVRGPELAAGLAAPALQLWRAKGLMRGADGGGLLLQGVGPRCAVAATDLALPIPSRLVCIAPRGGRAHAPPPPPQPPRPLRTR